MSPFTNPLEKTEGKINRQKSLEGETEKNKWKENEEK